MAHRALSIPDIVYLVFDQVGEDKPTLARSARCCKAFHKPSLDRLWRDLPSVFPLWNLLPPMKDRMIEPGHDEIWERFDLYAHRVRTWVHAHDAQFPLYLQHLEGRPGIMSFSSLLELQLNTRNELPAVFLLPLSLHRLHINFSFWRRKDSQQDEQYLFAAVDQAHFLEQLTLCGPVPLKPFARLPELRHLRILELGDAELPYGAMAILSSLPALTRLRLPKTSWTDAPRTGFRSLESLTLSGNASQIVQLLQSLTTTNLRAITIHNSVLDMSPSSLTDWQQCFKTLEQKFESSLRSFDMEAVAREDGLSVMKLFEPLMGLHQLEEFRLSELITLSPQVVSAMTSSWPHLRRFMLDIPPILADSSQNVNDCQPYAFHCLTLVARHCPKLTALYIGIGDHDLPTVSEFPLLSHGLADLRLHTPYIHDNVHLARLLDRIFPMLVEVRVNHALRNHSQEWDGFGLIRDERWST
ncbi:hypothetical protein PILCRDRAFT_341329 [Piloderma croceum F 1598]|uniref:F-box domain-containing protein n=1 Tax=Piloderma croceum (strain F 1598) TaxID=765440 RepID=A0A0C3C7P2_PILCF|nr:hypothetical protein PILCRDRAFT_341329 [Piloderma croceum F 1598]